MTYPERIERLEALLGDPLDPTNPLGHQAVVAADERGELLAEGEAALASYGLGAEFVPVALGGRFDRADHFARLMRSVFRRDCALGIGHGVTSFIAGLPVWAAGNEAQRRKAADILLSGGRIVAAYTELAHGSDFSRTALTARPDPGAAPGGTPGATPGGYVLDGGKQLINNIGRAEAAVLFARTDDRPGSRGHSHLLVDLTQVPPERADRSARFATSGVRGCLLGGVRFDGCPVPADALLGAEGGAMETVLKVFQVTRSVLPSMVVGVGDSQLRTVLGFARERVLYGGPVAELPLPRAELTGVFADLLACDALATTGARALHLLPEETSVLSAAVKYLVPKVLQDASYRLGVLLGARGYLREGPYAAFQKAARDLPVVALAHAGSAVCQASIVPQLPRIAERSWRPALSGDVRRPVPAGLFRPDEELPALDYDRLALNGRGADTLAAALPALAAQTEQEPELAALARLFTAELAALADRCAALPPRDRTAVAGRRAFLLADRYAHLLAATACLGIWRDAAPGSFTADPRWVTGALHRLAERLALRPAPLSEPVTAFLYEEAVDRHDNARTFDLFRGRLAQRTVLSQGASR
ncbi:acyl-CoA dehydrogenase family protein [Streptomyces sp. E11-3]|uniref:acyl-CoA dehydrogenase family protein n=1 Tax=Streptomyces sp. E11-3 TaxID=3110112 RepID=UPI00397F8E1E